MTEPNRRLCTNRKTTGSIALGWAMLACTSGFAEVPTQAALQAMFPPVLQEKLGPPDTYDFEDRAGFVEIFDGATLEDWHGDLSVWRVEDGKIVGERAETTLRNNDYLTYKGVSARDFELKLEINVIEGGSGIQYRSRTGEPWTQSIPGAEPPNLDWMLTGPQADIWAGLPAWPTVFNGGVYLENERRGVVAWRGQITQSSSGKKEKLIGRIGDEIELGGHIVTGGPAQVVGGLPLVGGWNQYHIIARGGVMMHLINGQLMAIYIDDDPESPDNQSGYVGLELETQPTRIEVRDIWLKVLQ